jgi:hypothetical protein
VWEGAATFLSPGQCQIWEYIRPFHRTFHVNSSTVRDKSVEHTGKTLAAGGLGGPPAGPRRAHPDHIGGSGLEHLVISGVLAAAA